MKLASKPLTPCFVVVRKAFVQVVCRNQRVFEGVETCNRSPMIPLTIPNYNFAFANLILLFVQHFLRRPFPTLKKVMKEHRPPKGTKTAPFPTNA